MDYTYDEADGLLRKRDTKKVGNNTYLVRGEGCIHVRLHKTNVVTMYPDNTYRLNSGGWRTATTKQRINRFSPVKIYQHKYQWYLAGGQPFCDGVVVQYEKPPYLRSAS